MESSKYTAYDVYVAVKSKKWGEVEHIISTQPELLSKKHNNVTSLCRIVLRGNSEEFILRILNSAKQYEIDELNTEPLLGDFSILHYLVLRGYSQALRLALAISKSRLNWKDQDGYTPLHDLLRSNLTFEEHLNCLQVLIDTGADINIKNKDGLTPVDKYIKNECKKYNKTTKENQKEEILHKLKSKATQSDLCGVSLAKRARLTEDSTATSSSNYFRSSEADRIHTLETTDNLGPPSNLSNANPVDVKSSDVGLKLNCAGNTQTKSRTDEYNETGSTRDKAINHNPIDSKSNDPGKQ